jgi:hypothetical protein
LTPPFRYWVPGPLPSQNDMIAAAKGFRGRGIGYSTMKKLWTLEAARAAQRAGLPLIARGRFTLIWHGESQRRDPDNISAGIKFILDGLVVAGILENDGWAQVSSIAHEFVLDKERPGVEVVIDPV